MYTMNPASILPYKTWVLIWDPQNMRGIPDFIEKIISINYNRSKQKRRRYFNSDIY